MFGPFREVERCLASRIASTDQAHVAIFVLLGFGGRRAIEDADPNEVLKRWDV
jgi:hypothetical protein